MGTDCKVAAGEIQTTKAGKSTLVADSILGPNFGPQNGVRLSFFLSGFPFWLHLQAGASVYNCCGPASCDREGPITRDRRTDLGRFGPLGCFLDLMIGIPALPECFQACIERLAVPPLGETGNMQLTNAGVGQHAKRI